MSVFKEFLAFLEADPNHPCDFMSMGECALARFGQSRENEGTSVYGGAWSYSVDNNIIPVIPTYLQDHWYGTDYGTARRILHANAVQQNRGDL